MNARHSRDDDSQEGYKSHKKQGRTQIEKFEEWKAIK